MHKISSDKSNLAVTAIGH